MRTLSFWCVRRWSGLLRCRDVFAGAAKEKSRRVPAFFMRSLPRDYFFSSAGAAGAASAGAAGAASAGAAGAAASAGAAGAASAGAGAGSAGAAAGAGSAAGAGAGASSGFEQAARAAARMAARRRDFCILISLAVGDNVNSVFPPDQADIARPAQNISMTSVRQGYGVETRIYKPSLVVLMQHEQAAQISPKRLA